MVYYIMKQMNLKEKIQERIKKIPRNFDDEEKIIALTSIYTDFENEGYAFNVISTLMYQVILENLKEKYLTLHSLLNKIQENL